MPLLSFWKSDPEATSKLSIQQIVGTAGDGKLRDESKCSKELRAYLREVGSEKLAEYINSCLSAPFSESGLVLQDLVNELGRRLDFEVTDGLYQGKKGSVGNDGLWMAPEGNSLVIEVKTTDAYRISLDIVAGYRQKLLESGQIGAQSSILLVVGRKDTGEIEAQVRGSRHAWDVRLISMDSLVSLVKLKESAEENETITKIRSVLVPLEYTRLDSLVDIMFTTAQDVETSVETEEVSQKEDIGQIPDSKKIKGTWEFTDAQLLQQKRTSIISALAKREDSQLIKKSRALFWNSSHELRVACAVSKRYLSSGSQRYWYAYHPQWDEFLAKGSTGYFILGCMDLDIAFVIPREVMKSITPFLNTTTRKGTNRKYWHIHIVEPSAKKYGLLLNKKSETLPIDEYILAL